MDKTTRVLLGVAIAIIYPILVIIGVTQVITVSDAKMRPQYPQRENTYSSRPVCNQLSRTINGSSTRTSTPGITSSITSSEYDEYSKCLDERAAYDKQAALNDAKYDAEVAKYEKQLRDFIDAQKQQQGLRALAVLVIGAVSIIACYFLRSYRELAGGMVVACSLLIAGSVLTLATQGKDMVNIKLSTALFIIIFIALVVLLRFVDTNVMALYPEDSPAGTEMDTDTNESSSGSEKSEVTSVVTGIMSPSDTDTALTDQAAKPHSVESGEDKVLHEDSGAVDEQAPKFPNDEAHEVASDGGQDPAASKDQSGS